MKLFPLIFFLLAAVAAQAQQPQLTRDADGRLLQSRHGVYDNHDRLAVEIIYGYGDDGSVETRTLKQYDRQGRVTREETYTADEYLLFVQDHRYDRQGRLVRTTQTSYDDNGIPSVTRLRYTYTPAGEKQVEVVE